MDNMSYKTQVYQHLLVEEFGGDLNVVLNRPKKLNAVNLAMLDELWQVFEHINQDDSVRVVIISAKGKAFCAGLDLQGPLSSSTEAPLNNKQRMTIQKRLSRLLALIYNLQQPVIAAASGAACGFGLGLLCASDIRYGDPSLKANAAFIKLGFTGCDMGVSYFLPKIIGLTAANEMMLTGRFYTSEKLLARGFIAEICPPSELIDTAKKAAEDMLKASPFGLRMTKEGIRHNQNAASLEAALALEDRQQILVSYSGDQERALYAFISGEHAQFEDD